MILRKLRVGQRDIYKIGKDEENALFLGNNDLDTLFNKLFIYYFRGEIDD